MARFNPNDETQLSRLRSSMRWSKKRLAPFRRDYMDALREYVGARFGDEGTATKRPFNEFRMAVDIYSRQLAAQSPHVLALTFDRSLLAQAKMLETAVNSLLLEMDLGVIVREAVKSALLAMGIVKVGLSMPGDGKPGSMYYESGQPYAEVVLFDDWLHDMTARRVDEWSWAGNRYRVSYDDVIDSDLYDRDGKKDLQRMTTGKFSTEGEEEGRSHELSQGTGGFQEEEYRDHVELWDIWLPSDKLLVTLPVQGDGPPLRVIEWEGPERGPYHVLTFGEVPGNVMPSPPAAGWIELNDIMNRLFTKLGRQAERQKTLTFASGSAASDGSGQRIAEAEDGQVIKVDNAQDVREAQYGGIHPGNMAFAMQLKELFSYLAGNLDAIGGLSAQGDTLGQEKIIKSSSSQMVQDAADKVIKFTTGIVSDLGFYIYDDPVAEIPLSMKVRGIEQDIPFQWSPEDRKEAYVKYRIKLEPYSMQSKSPGSRIQSIFTIMSQVLLPMQQQMTEQGVELDVETLMEVVAKYSDLPELQDILRIGGVPIGTMKDDSPKTVQPAATGAGKPQGQYTRTNVTAGASPGGDMMKEFMKSSGSQQPNAAG